MTTYQPNDLAEMGTRPLEDTIKDWDTDEVVDLFVQLDAITVALSNFRRELRADLAGSLDEGVVCGHKILKPKRQQVLVGTAEQIRRRLLEVTRAQFYTVDGGEAWAVPEDDVRQFWTNKNAPASLHRELGLETEWRAALEVSNL